MTAFLSRHIANFRSVAQDFRVRRDRARTERFLAELPGDIRKDIGWPDSHDERIVPAATMRWNAESFLAKTACPQLFWVEDQPIRIARN